jgi:hypothetical protein
MSDALVGFIVGALFAIVAMVVMFIVIRFIEDR